MHPYITNKYRAYWFSDDSPAVVLVPRSPNFRPAYRMTPRVYVLFFEAACRTDERLLASLLREVYDQNRPEMERVSNILAEMLDWMRGYPGGMASIAEVVGEDGKLPDANRAKPNESCPLKDEDWEAHKSDRVVLGDGEPDRSVRPLGPMVSISTPKKKVARAETKSKVSGGCLWD